MKTRAHASAALACLGITFLLVACDEPLPEPKPKLRTGQAIQIASAIKGDEIALAGPFEGQRLRLVGIHALAAEIGQPTLDKYAALSLKTLTEWLKDGATVEIRQPMKDMSGRYLGYLATSGGDVNRRMVEQGLALVYTEFAFVREADYLAAEAKARAEKTGIWAEDAATLTILRGLRKQWAELRTGREGPALADPWLAQTP